MRIYLLATASIFIATSFDAAARPQAETMRNEAVTMGEGKCMNSTNRPRGKYSIASLELGLISKTPKVLGGTTSLNHECRPQSDKAPDRELKLLVRPRVLARLRTT
jgi:hypothetical protein